MFSSTRSFSLVCKDFFQSVFKDEKFGPLEEKCYSKYSESILDMKNMVANATEVAGYLLELDCNKSMGPDNIHPKLLKYLGEDPAFVDALTKLFNKCISEQRIPDIWKSAIVVPLHKGGSVHAANN